MKKLIAGLLGLALSVMTVVPAMAQNKVGRYDAVSVGAVNYSLNSGGSFYGQLLNSGSASAWSLGFGSSNSTVGTGVLTWNNAGHVLLQGSAVPAASSCGNTPSVVLGSDNAGDVSIGSAASSSCTLTFVAAYSVIPHCFCSDRTTKVPCIAQPTLSTVVLVGTTTNPMVSGDTLDYVCIGH